MLARVLPDRQAQLVNFGSTDSGLNSGGAIQSKLLFAPSLALDDNSAMFVPSYAVGSYPNAIGMKNIVMNRTR